METLNNFASIYCFITFVIGALFMLTILSIVAVEKTNEPRNNIRFFVARDKNGELWLYLSKPIRMKEEFVSCSHGKALTNHFSKYSLNENDYANLKWEDEPVEVYLNLKD